MIEAELKWGYQDECKDVLGFIIIYFTGRGW
jgi:hypothetical protein